MSASRIVLVFVIVFVGGVFGRAFYVAATADSSPTTPPEAGVSLPPGREFVTAIKPRTNLYIVTKIAAIADPKVYELDYGSKGDPFVIREIAGSTPVAAANLTTVKLKPGEKLVGLLGQEYVRLRGVESQHRQDFVLGRLQPGETPSTYELLFGDTCKPYAVVVETPAL